MQSHVGASLLAKAVYQSTSMLNLPPPSLASQLPQVSALFSITAFTTKSCGSWLASDEAGPGNSCID